MHGGVLWRSKIRLRTESGASLMRAVMFEPVLPDAALLHARGAAQQRWHEAAREQALARFGHEVFLRGVVEVSNYCRENCHYCGMRRDNRALDRHRARLDALTELLLNHRPESVTDINLQAGEDPVVVREVVLPLVERLRNETTLGVSVCLGSLSADLYHALQAAGASTYILKFEIANARQYAAFQAPGTHAERLAHIRLLAETGWRVSSGFIAGLPGQGDDERVAVSARSFPAKRRRWRAHPRERLT
jgi:biotin synthase